MWARRLIVIGLVFSFGYATGFRSKPVTQSRPEGRLIIDPSAQIIVRRGHDNPIPLTPHSVYRDGHNHKLCEPNKESDLWYVYFNDSTSYVVATAP